MKPYLTLTFAVSIIAVSLFSLALALSSLPSLAADLAVTDTKAPVTSSTDAPQAPDTNADKPPQKPTASLDYRSNGNGTCAVVGIGSHAEASLVIPEYAPSGDRVTAIAPQALRGVPTLTAIHIPASVSFIGALALAECRALAYVSVDPANPSYCAEGGVLYSADRSALILYPPRRAGDTVVIDTATTVIREMAFWECVYLKRVDFRGSAAQWEAVSVGAKNYALLAASIICVE